MMIKSVKNEGSRVHQLCVDRGNSKRDKATTKKQTLQCSLQKHCFRPSFHPLNLTFLLIIAGTVLNLGKCLFEVPYLVAHSIFERAKTSPVLNCSLPFVSNCPNK